LNLFFFKIDFFYNFKIFAHAELQRNKSFFVNFCPDYIGLEKPRKYSEEIWQLILIDLIPNEKFAEVHINKIKLKKKTYLHLELYEHYKSGSRETVINGYKENTFALGLMILELAFNIDMGNLYDDKYHLLRSNL
jgi:hypothetical protein